jgi:hypothetical protein
MLLISSLKKRAVWLIAHHHWNMLFPNRLILLSMDQLLSPFAAHCDRTTHHLCLRQRDALLLLLAKESRRAVAILMVCVVLPLKMGKNALLSIGGIMARRITQL